MSSKKIIPTATEGPVDELQDIEGEMMQIGGDAELDSLVSKTVVDRLSLSMKQKDSHLNQALIDRYGVECVKAAHILQRLIRGFLSTRRVRKLKERREKQRRVDNLMKCDLRYQVFMETKKVGAWAIICCPICPFGLRLKAFLAKSFLGYLWFFFAYIALNAVQELNYTTPYEYSDAYFKENNYFTDKELYDVDKYGIATLYHMMPDADFFAYTAGDIRFDWDLTVNAFGTPGPGDGTSNNGYTDFDANFKTYYSNAYRTINLHPNMGDEFWYNLYMDWKDIQEFYDSDLSMIESGFDAPPYVRFEVSKFMDKRVMKTDYSDLFWTWRLVDKHRGMTFYPPPPPRTFYMQSDAVVEAFDDFIEEEPTLGYNIMWDLFACFVFFILYLLSYSVNSIAIQPHHIPIKWHKSKLKYVHMKEKSYIFVEKVMEYLEIVILNVSNALLLYPYMIGTELDIEMILNGLAILFLCDMDENTVPWYCGKIEEDIVLTWHFKVHTGYPLDIDHTTVEGKKYSEEMQNAKAFFF